LPTGTWPAKATDANGAESAELSLEGEASKAKAARMNRQARVLLNFISSSSSGNSLGLQETSAQHSYYQRLIYTSLSHGACTTEGFHSLGRQLAYIARHADFIGQMDVVDQAVQIMRALPISGQLGSVVRHYQALCAKQKGDFDGARKLLERVVGEATPHYRARALQVLGTTHYECGEIDKALPFYVAAGKASMGCDLITLVWSQQMIAVIRSLHGDHKQALDDLEQLFPLVRSIGRHYPSVYYQFLNSFAVELGEVGRINEARSVCQLTLASPFAQSYPQWLETRDELEAKRDCATPSTVAVGAALGPPPARQVQLSREVKPALSLAFGKPAGETVSIQTAIAIAFAIIVNLEIPEGMLERVRHSIIPRGPPARL
jgi:tetratricopeptide (TPR) repeat protein